VVVEMTDFGARLAAAVAERGPLCVGIDPHRELLAAWGLADDPAGLERFSRGALEALAGEVALVKPQSAFFERHGSAGIAVLERLLADAREAGLLVVLDVKRAPLAADAVTLSPYLGFGSLAPALATAEASGRGVIVLARTSNPQGASVQSAERDGHSVAQGMVDGAAAANVGATPLGWVGVVVGATRDHGLDLSTLNGPVLAPGLGAQGAAPADLAARFAGVSGVVLPSVSRAVLGRGPDRTALREEVRSWRDALRAAG
jgi:orotidine-5'-phosphate decarboxylase